VAVGQVPFLMGPEEGREIRTDLRQQPGIEVILGVRLSKTATAASGSSSMGITSARLTTARSGSGGVARPP
jgi:hypothetical protein